MIESPSGGPPESQLNTPVALFVFNRPEQARRVLDAVAAVRPRQLLVVADGARANKAGESDLCQASRAVIDRVQWPCEVITNFSEVNLGCKRRIASGLDWVFSKVDQAILLEDDCLPEPSFFRFCEEMLARYRDDPRVHMIRGTNFLQGRVFGTSSYYFSRFYNIWGWASWARAWQHYDVDMRRWPGLRDSGWLERQLPAPEMAAAVRYFFDETHAGRVDTWDYQWLLAGWLQNALTVVPAQNLVANIGFGAAATHLKDEGSWLARMSTAPLEFPLRHAPAVEVLDEADSLEWSLVYPAPSGPPSLLRRLTGRLRRSFAARLRPA